MTKIDLEKNEDILDYLIKTIIRQIVVYDCNEGLDPDDPSYTEITKEFIEEELEAIIENMIEFEEVDPDATGDDLIKEFREYMKRNVIESELSESYYEKSELDRLVRDHKQNLPYALNIERDDDYVDIADVGSKKDMMRLGDITDAEVNLGEVSNKDVIENDEIERLEQLEIKKAVSDIGRNDENTDDFDDFDDFE